MKVNRWDHSGVADAMVRGFEVDDLADVRLRKGS